MILAAGRGERLRPFTDTCPKPLLEVRGKALIEYHLYALAAGGVSRVVINVSWLASQIEATVGDGSKYGVKVSYSRESEGLETAGGILNALEKLGERFIVVNADIVTDYAFEKLLSVDTQAHLVLVKNPAHNPQGDFSLDNHLVGNATKERYTFAGIACYHKSFFDGLAPGKRPLAPLLRKAAQSGQVTGELFRGRWVDIGTVERWQEIC